VKSGTTPLYTPDNLGVFECEALKLASAA